MSHQITRARAIQAAKQRLAHQAAAARMHVPPGQEQIDVGACGPDWNQGGYATPGYPWNASQEFWGLPNLAPEPFPGLLRSHLYRLGAIVQASADGPRTIELAPPNGASLYVAGFLSCNDCFQIIIHSIEQGSIGFSRVSEIDAAVFNSDVCYCPLECGCANNLTPLVISFSPFGVQSTPPYLNLTAVGTFDAGWGSCGVPYGNGYNTPLPTMPGAGLGVFPAGPWGGPSAGPPAG